MPPRKDRVSLTCGVCGSTFERLACQLTRGRGRFCSNACRFEGGKRQTVLHCTLCDAPFSRHLSEQDSERQFCSRPCYMEWRALNRGDTYPRQGPEHVHRLVAASVLGRPLRPGEVVHHLDEDKTHNDRSNLAVFPNQSYHARCHFGEMADDELHGYSLAFGAPAL